jgi:hypothetical protein
MSKYLDKDGLTYLWEKIKKRVDSLEIGSFVISNDGLTSEIFPPADYTQEDLTKAADYSVDPTGMTTEELEKYDLNKDGIVNIADVLKIEDLMNTNASTTAPAILEVNSRDPLKSIAITDNTGNQVVNINLTSATLPKLSVPSLTVGGKEVDITDTGWKNLTLNSTCTTGGYSGTPQYRKIGNHVYIRGSVSVTASSSTILIATLPEGFRPSNFFYKTNMSQANCIWRQTIGESGNINCEWIIDTVAGAKKTSGTYWLELNLDYLTD